MGQQLGSTRYSPDDVTPESGIMKHLGLCRKTLCLLGAFACVCMYKLDKWSCYQEKILVNSEVCREGKHIYLFKNTPCIFLFIRHFSIPYFLFTTVGGYYSSILKIKKCVIRWLFDSLLNYLYLPFQSAFNFQG